MLLCLPAHVTGSTSRNTLGLSSIKLLLFGASVGGQWQVQFARAGQFWRQRRFLRPATAWAGSGCGCTVLQPAEGSRKSALLRLLLCKDAKAGGQKVDLLGWFVPKAMLVIVAMDGLACLKHRFWSLRKPTTT